MLRLIRFIITGSWHEHTYEVINKVGVSNGRTGGVCGNFYVSRCTVCGKIKSTQVNVK